MVLVHADAQIEIYYLIGIILVKVELVFYSRVIEYVYKNDSFLIDCYKLTVRIMFGL